jgi:hypothetical protein
MALLLLLFSAAVVLLYCQLCRCCCALLLSCAAAAALLCCCSAPAAVLLLLCSTTAERGLAALSFLHNDVTAGLLGSMKHLFIPAVTVGVSGVKMARNSPGMGSPAAGPEQAAVGVQSTCQDLSKQQWECKELGMVQIR